MKTNVDLKVNVTLSTDELIFLSSVLCGLTGYCREDLSKLFRKEDFNRSLLESLAIGFSSISGRCKAAKEKYNL